MSMDDASNEIDISDTALEAYPEDDASRPMALSGTLDFMRLLWAVDHALQSTSKRMEQRLGVTAPQRLVVRIVGQFPSASAGAIARILQIHPSTLTGILRRLEARGILERKPDPKDGRRALFQLTASGRDLDRIVEGTPEAAVGRALEKLDAHDLDGARKVLGAMTAALEQMMAEQDSLKH